MSSITLETIRDHSVADIAALTSEDLFEVRMEASTLLSAVKQLADRIDQALDRKYAEAAQALRFSQGKDTGIVHFDDGAVRITADLPKKVDWDQHQLAEIARRIQANGDNPFEFIDLTYKVSEAKFNAWPESIKSVFVPARTLKTGKPSFRLALLSEGGAQ